MSGAGSSTCEPSRELQTLLEVIGRRETARVLHAVSRAAAVTAVDLTRRLGVDRAVVERSLRDLEGVGLVERSTRAPSPSIWSVRPKAVQRAGLAWISYALGNPERSDSDVPDKADGCCGARR